MSTCPHWAAAMREVREVTSSASFTRAPLSRRNWGGGTERGGGGSGRVGKRGERKGREEGEEEGEGGRGEGGRGER